MMKVCCDGAQEKKEEKKQRSIFIVHKLAKDVSVGRIQPVCFAKIYCL